MQLSELMQEQEKEKKPSEEEVQVLAEETIRLSSNGSEVKWEEGSK